MYVCPCICLCVYWNLMEHTLQSETETTAQFDYRRVWVRYLMVIMQCCCCYFHFGNVISQCQSNSVYCKACLCIQVNVLHISKLEIINLAIWYRCFIRHFFVNKTASNETNHTQVRFQSYSNALILYTYIDLLASDSSRVPFCKTNCHHHLSNNIDRKYWLTN